MFVIFILFLALSVVFSYKRALYGCQFLLVSRILIPECVRLTPVADISLNTGVIFVTTIFVLKEFVFKRGNLNLKGKCLSYLIVLILFVLGWYLTVVLGDAKDRAFQISQLIQFTLTDILPIILLCITIRNKEDLELTLKVLFSCAFISCLWGCISWLIGANPYTFAINSVYSKREYLIENVNLSDGRGIMSTSGTFEHANGWGYFLPITFVMVFFYHTKRPSKFNVILLILLTICTLICGKRSALVAYFFFWIGYFYLFLNIKRLSKWMVYGLIGILVLYVAVSILPELEKGWGLLESSIFFWDDSIRDRNDIGGSSWEMRIAQITYPFYEIRENLLFGHGYGWTAHYLSLHDFHPIMYGFENLLSEALCNGGIFGVVLWGFLFSKSYRYSSQNEKDKKYYLLFTMVQLAVGMATGLSYLIFYGLYIVILNKFYLLNSNENIRSNRNLQLRKRD